MQPRHLLINDAGSGHQRIGHMLVDRIAEAHGSGDAALRPGGRRTVTDRGRGQNGDGTRR